VVTLDHKIAAGNFFIRDFIQKSFEARKIH
jgi:hypothetical protein